MPLFEMTKEAFRELEQSSFQELNVLERGDLQRLLRTQIEVLGDDLYVLAEEFSDWEDSKRRIDLLALDLQANLVVIELKRTSDGGHMELQAVRYASMISAMTFEDAVDIHQKFLQALSQPGDEAQARILTFLGWEDPEEEPFAQDIRIVLVSEDFGKELTTAVLWLRDRDIDIRCIRLNPYRDGSRILVDVEHLIPLPEAQEYQVQRRKKEQEVRQVRAERSDIRLRFWLGLLAVAQKKGTRHASLKPGAYQYFSARTGIRGLSFTYFTVKEKSNVELYVDRGDSVENKALFDRLMKDKEAIEGEFGQALEWERLDNRRACRIKVPAQEGGYRSQENEWTDIHNELVDTMTRLEKVLQPRLDALGL
jgi:hypothetical protein